MEHLFNGLKLALVICAVIGLICSFFIGVAFVGAYLSQLPLIKAGLIIFVTVVVMGAGFSWLGEWDDRRRNASKN